MKKDMQRVISTLFPDIKFQTILGWGGAFTDSAGINIASLDSQAQDLLIRYFLWHPQEFFPGIEA